ncbi:ejaculatory bulb-specific protein 3-like [Schistocerca gregaria]|uniref:ejaculatory bulb-specific protein 3-like n=1 Tax=Schistocerca gregaria TaxID=7010 RepID=UPI00211E9811|nr:ejaculatory bulb-specific protein 3-like [Schistocerca gregaria]
MWKAFGALMVLMAAALTLLPSAADGQITTKLDNLDLDRILNSDRLFNAYAECLLSDGKDRCTPEGTEVKVLLLAGLQTDCAKCNDNQKARMDKIIRFTIGSKKALWEKLKAKYDPEDKYFKNYERRFSVTS